MEGCFLPAVILLRHVDECSDQQKLLSATSNSFAYLQLHKSAFAPVNVPFELLKCFSFSFNCCVKTIYLGRDESSFWLCQFLMRSSLNPFSFCIYNLKRRNICIALNHLTPTYTWSNGMEHFFVCLQVNFNSLQQPRLVLVVCFTRISKVIRPCLLLRAEGKELAQGHPAEFVPKVKLELTVLPPDALLTKLALMIWHAILVTLMLT